MWNVLLDPKTDAVLNVVIVAALVIWIWQQYQATERARHERSPHWNGQENLLRGLGAKVETHADEIQDLKVRLQRLERAMKPKPNTQQASQPEQ